MPLVTKPIRDYDDGGLRILAVGERTEDDRLNCPLYDFFSAQKLLHPKPLQRLTALFDVTIERGTLANEQKFKHLTGTDGLWEFKAKPLRVICFFDQDKVIICTNAVVKGSQKADPQTLQTAANWKNAYYEAQRDGSLIHEKSKD